MLVNSLGECAEEVTVRYIQERGWRLLERNVNRPWGELDIIARDGDITVCIEVKGGKKGALLDPEEHFDGRKRRKVARACEAYLAREVGSSAEYRIDLAAVQIDEITRRARVRYYKNVGEEA